jgi:hypothetical protein
MQALNKTGKELGLQPYCTDEWSTQKDYLMEYGDIPVMLTAMSSDSLAETSWKRLELDEIEEATETCNVRYIRLHEIMSYHHSNNMEFPFAYVKKVLALSVRKKIPVFWNEWDTTKYPEIKRIINKNVVMSFATNNEYMEPVDGYKLLSPFKHKGASVQSWYWWERNGRQNGYELLMPPELMRQHTCEAFDARCEVIQYEPMGYFIKDWKPVDALKEILAKQY